MSEVSEKISFAQVRASVHFSIPELAKNAKVNTLVIYHMLLGEPVKRWQAEEVLKTLSAMKKIDYTFDTVLVVLAD